TAAKVTGDGGFVRAIAWTDAGIWGRMVTGPGMVRGGYRSMNDEGHADRRGLFQVVPGARFELARGSPYAPQTYVSTNSTTRARIPRIFGVSTCRRASARESWAQAAARRCWAPAARQCSAQA